MSWYIEQCFKFDSSTVENESSHKAKNLESGLTLLWNRQLLEIWWDVKSSLRGFDLNINQENRSPTYKGVLLP